jgi:hypothetical protein
MSTSSLDSTRRVCVGWFSFEGLDKVGEEGEEEEVEGDESTTTEEEETKGEDIVTEEEVGFNGELILLHLPQQ